MVQIQGKERELVAQVGKQLGLDGTYIARSYIEQIQLEKLTAAFQNVPEGLRRHFSVEGAAAAMLQKPLKTQCGRK